MSERTSPLLAAVICAGLHLWTVSADAADIAGRLKTADMALGDRLTVFGDSYSDIRSTTYPFPKWSEQVLTAGYVRWLRSFALGGSIANDLGREGRTEATFKAQVDRFARSPGLRYRRDVIAVHLGQIDVIRHAYPESADLSRAKADYKRQLDRLIGLGATGDNRRILLFLAPDRGFNRGDATIVRKRTRQWNHWLTSLAANRHGVGTVDLFTTVDRVRANPAMYGLTNIWRGDPVNHETTALLYDTSHFGRRGHEIIASVFAEALAEPVGAAVLADTARVAVGAWHMQASMTLGQLDPATMQEPGRSLSIIDLGEESRAGEEWRDPKVGIAWAPDSETLVGMAVGAATSASGSPAATWRSGADASARGATLLLGRSYGDLRLLLAASMLDAGIDRSQFDTLIDRGASSHVDGRALAVSARLSWGLRWNGATVTPSAELHRQRLDLESYRLESPYGNGVEYADMQIDDFVARIGLDVSTDPVDLGYLGLLRVGGSWHLGRNLTDDAYDLRTVRNGQIERERAARSDLSRHRLDLTGSLEPMPGVHLAANGGVAVDDEAAWAAGLRLALRF